MDNLKRLNFLAEHMDTKDDVNEFEEKLSHYYGKSDSETLKDLLSLFTDNCPYYEVMWGLVHLVETWPKEIYVNEVIQSLEEKIKIASFWMDCLFNRIFNDDSYLGIFKNNFKYVDKTSLLKLFDVMEKESPHHSSLIQELRKELENT